MSLTYIKACVMTCKRPLFWRYLMYRTCRLITTEGEALKAVRMLIDIRSRTELVEGTRAAMDWRYLIQDFNNWNKSNDPKN